jgi:hypothetical protein
VVGQRQQEGVVPSAIGEYQCNMGVNHHGQPGLFRGEQYRVIPPDAESVFENSLC